MGCSARLWLESSERAYRRYLPRRARDRLRKRQAETKTVRRRDRVVARSVPDVRYLSPSELAIEGLDNQVASFFRLPPPST